MQTQATMWYMPQVSKCLGLVISDLLSGSVNSIILYSGTQFGCFQ